MDTALAGIVGGQASSDASMMPWGREAEGCPLAFGGRSWETRSISGL